MNRTPIAQLCNRTATTLHAAAPKHKRTPMAFQHGNGLETVFVHDFLYVDSAGVVPNKARADSSSVCGYQVDPRGAVNVGVLRPHGSVPMGKETAGVVQ